MLADSLRQCKLQPFVEVQSVRCALECRHIRVLKSAGTRMCVEDVS